MHFRVIRTEGRVAYPLDLLLYVRMGDLTFSVYIAHLRKNPN